MRQAGRKETQKKRQVNNDNRYYDVLRPNEPFLNSQERQKSKFKKNSKFHFFFFNIEKQVVPSKSNAREVSFEWSHHRILLTDSKVRTTLHVHMS